MIDCVPSKVSDNMNSVLTGSVTAEQVLTAPKQKAPSKEPGLDGMLAAFFQKYWDVVGPSVSIVFKFFFENYTSLAAINNIPIALVPKCTNPKSMVDFDLLAYATWSIN